jgi:hypothetical protein
VIENKLLRRLYVPNRDEVTGEWRRRHDDRLNDLYFSRNIFRVIKSRRMRWEGYEACMGERRNIYKDLVGKPEGKRLLGKPRRRSVSNIKIDLQEVGCREWTECRWLGIGTVGGYL